MKEIFELLLSIYTSCNALFCSVIRAAIDEKILPVSPCGGKGRRESSQMRSGRKARYLTDYGAKWVNVRSYGLAT
jgi:hypothetical protein